MNLISETFAKELDEKDMRDAYLAAQTRTKIAHQIRALRQQRGWSQGEFGERLGKPQSNVSRLEAIDEGKYTLQTLLELASAFDVGLVVEFVAYEDFIRHTLDLSPSALRVDSFTESALEPLYTSSPGASATLESTGLNWVSLPSLYPICISEQSKNSNMSVQTLVYNAASFTKSSSLTIANYQETIANYQKLINKCVSNTHDDQGVLTDEGDQILLVYQYTSGLIVGLLKQ